MHKQLVGWYAAALAVAAAVVFLFPALGLRNPANPHFALHTAWCAAILVCQIGAVWYFWVSLSNFKPLLRRAYKELSVGIICLGLAQLQLPIITYLDGWNSLYARSGAVLLPYLATVAAMYLGVRTFARVMQIRTMWLRWWLALPASILGIALTLGVFWRLEDALASFLYDGLVGWSVAGGVITVWIAAKLKASLSPAFQPAMRWLVASFAITIVAGFHQLWLQHFTTEASWYREYGFSVWVLLVASMAFLQTGLAFKQLTVGLSANARLLDVIMYTAELVSRPQDIDPVLDRLRLLTAALQPGAEPTEEQHRQLVAIYLELEDYLVTREPVRSFTMQGLRLGLPDAFVSQLPA